MTRHFKQHRHQKLKKRQRIIFQNRVGPSTTLMTLKKNQTTTAKKTFPPTCEKNLFCKICQKFFFVIVIGGIDTGAGLSHNFKTLVLTQLLTLTQL
jgi:hypothetical protein